MLTLLTRVCIALIVTLAFCMRSSSVNATNLPSYYYSFQRPTVTTHILHQGHEDKIRVNTIAMITLRIEKGFQNLLEKYNLSDIHLMVRIGYAGLPVGSTQICTEYEQNCSDVFLIKPHIQ